MRCPQQVQYSEGGSKVRRDCRHALHMESLANSNMERWLLIPVLAGVLRSISRWVPICIKLNASTREVPAFAFKQ